MQKYINQLLQDIAAVEPFQESSAFDSDTDTSLEKHFEEVERYLHQDSFTTLAQHTGLSQEAFPEAKLLTEMQCGQVQKGLKKAYWTLGISLDIPEDIPVKVKYRFYVEALGKTAFVCETGMTTIEYCHYDFSGDCPFEVEKCSCYRRMEEAVENTKQKSKEEWFDMEAMEVYWYDFLKDYASCQHEFKNSATPNKSSVEKLWRQLEEAHKAMLREDASIYFAPKEEDMPDGEYRSLFEWLKVGRLVFPKRSQLSDLELRLLSMALIQLCGKELIIVNILDWKVEKQYDELVAHFSRWMKKNEDSEYLNLLCQPQPITLFDKVKAEKQKFRSEYGNFTEKDDKSDIPFKT